jgi:uncharacterized protein YdaL
MTSTLVLYDTTGAWGYLGELYAIGAANLGGHFGTVTAKPVTSYAAGELNGHTGVVYLGSTYDEPLPVAFLDDVLAGARPVIWCGFNIWQLSARADQSAAGFVSRYGWAWTGFDFARIDEVRYKGISLTRDGANNAGGVMNSVISDPAVATVVASAVRSDGTTFPWALRAGSLTYVGEIPFSYMREEDRVLVFADLLFDALAPATPTRHRALVRIEDVSADSDPAQLRAIADYLQGQGVPFGIALIARYLDPQGVYTGGVAENVPLRANSAVVNALKYMQARGGVIVMHGYTHQWTPQINPYTKVSGDDYEFYRVTENADHSLTYVGPLEGDSAAATDDKIAQARTVLTNAGLTQPAIFEFPHYTGSATAYRTVATRFTTRWERTLYYSGVLRGGAVDHQRPFGQFFPYVVTDVYGTKVLPENLGNVEPEPWFIYPARLPADIVNAARKNLAVRDGFASFYFHPFLDLRYLRDTVAGIKGLGYSFVRPDPALL